MGEKRRIGLVFGGSSVEHEVSVVSARGIREGLEAGPFETIPVGVTEDGRWLPPKVSGPILDGDRPRVEAAAGDVVELRIDPGCGDIMEVDAGGSAHPLRIEAIFPVIHGWGGEDGRIQGLLDLAEIPYVGAGVLGSAVGMDKEISKSLFEHRGLPVGPWSSVRKDEYRQDPGYSRRSWWAQVVITF